MWSGVKRRLQLREYDDQNYEMSGLNEPSLKYRKYNDKHSERQTSKGISDEERRVADLQWAFLFSNLIAQWTNWIANIVQGSGSFITQLFLLPLNILNGQNQKLVPPVLTPLQTDAGCKQTPEGQEVTMFGSSWIIEAGSKNEEERLRKLQQRIAVPFDGSRVEHQDALWQLWSLAYPDRELPSLKSELWKDMGWQGLDPSTDFRGGGFISLENLIFFAKKYPESFQSLLHKPGGNRSDWEYPFAVAGINISFMLIQILNLRAGIPWSLAGIQFLKLLDEDEMAFDNLYCVAFQMMDAQWLAKRASYMDFNDVLKSTSRKLECEMALENISSVKDLPAFTLLKR